MQPPPPPPPPLLLLLLLLTMTTTYVCFRLKDLPTHQQMLIACIVVQASCKDVTVASVVQAYTKACKCVPVCVLEVSPPALSPHHSTSGT